MISWVPSVFPNTLLTNATHWKMNPFPRHALYDSVVSVEAYAFYTLKNVIKSHNDWGWKGYLKDVWLNHHDIVFHRHWNWLHARGSKEHKCICCSLASHLHLQRRSRIGTISCAETAQARREREGAVADSKIIVLCGGTILSLCVSHGRVAMTEPCKSFQIGVLTSILNVNTYRG